MHQTEKAPKKYARKDRGGEYANLATSHLPIDSKRKNTQRVKLGNWSRKKKEGSVSPIMKLKEESKRNIYTNKLKKMKRVMTE